MFSILAAYTLRKKDLTGPDADAEGTFIDEEAPRYRLSFGSAYEEDDGW